MTANPRRWFQIHLSTAIVLMFVAGGLLWLNIKPDQYVFVHKAAEGVFDVKIGTVLNDDKLLATPMLTHETDDGYVSKDGAVTRANLYGWPRSVAHSADLVYLGKGSVTGVARTGKLGWIDPYQMNLIYNLLAAAAILGATAVILEISARRREARQL